jgi:hypothetical protein
MQPSITTPVLEGSGADVVLGFFVLCPSRALWVGIFRASRQRRSGEGRGKAEHAGRATRPGRRRTRPGAPRRDGLRMHAVPASRWRGRRVFGRIVLPVSIASARRTLQGTRRCCRRRLEQAAGKDGPGEQEALRHIAAHRHEQIALLLRFHALGDDTQIEIPGKAHDRRDDRAGARIVGKPPDKAPVHLDEVDREFDQMGQ